jgi:pimeloyl-ACP methyl ester carboxylesterase
MDGQSDGVAAAGGSVGHREKFGAAYTRMELPGMGHNLPQEAPAAFVEAVLRLAVKA